MLRSPADLALRHGAASADGDEWLQDRAAHSDTSRESNGHRGTHSAIQYARVAKGWLFMLHASEIRGSHSVKTLP